MKEKSDISDGIGWPDWKLTLCLFGSWIVVFFVIVRGVKSSGKASYFLALFPYVVIIILLVHACTLEGSVNGILFFLKPQWGELLNAKVKNVFIIEKFIAFYVTNLVYSKQIIFKTKSKKTKHKHHSMFHFTFNTNE